MADELKKLRCVSKLYGRSEEFSILLDAYNRVASSSSDENACNVELVLVSGYSGTGKSALVQQLRDNHLERQEQGFFASGKFELLHRSEPYSAILSAFNDLFYRLLHDGNDGEKTRTTGESLRQKARDMIQNHVDEDSTKILMGLIPSLCQVMNGVDAVQTATGGGSSVEARNLAFRSLARTLGMVSRPLVLFLDDLQWADSSSLDLIKALVTDDHSSGVLYIGTYRDNEVDHSHPLSVRLREMESSDQIHANISKIQLDNLSQETVNELVADVLGMETTDTASLTNVIHDRTQGNVFFVMRFLESLIDEGLVVFFLGLFRWKWDVDHIRADTSISDNVVDLMANKIRKKLSEEDRSVLMLAACFGSRFDAKLLQQFIDTSKASHEGTVKEQTFPYANHKEQSTPYVNVVEGLDNSLGMAIKEGLIERYKLLPASASYRFAHDRIHQAAYSLIPAGRERELLHMQIGDLIYEQRKLALEKQDTSHNTDWMLFIATDQLNIGSSQYTKADADRRRNLAKLNLEAGQKAMQSSAFVPAASYLRKGVNLLEKGCQWDDDYDLSLKLYNASSSAEYGCGNHELSRQRANEILRNAKCFQHKTTAIYVIVKILRNERKCQEALDFCMDILAQAGQRMSRNPTWPTVKAEFLRARRMLSRRSDQDIHALPPLKDGDEYSLVAQFMCPLMVSVTHRMHRCDLTTLLTVRSVQLMLRNGVSPFCPFALVLLGTILCKEGHPKEGFRCDQLATSMLDRRGLQSWQPTIAYFTHSAITHWVNGRHIQDSLDPLLKNYEDGILSGDIYIAFGSVYIYAMTYLNCGLPLGGIEKDLRAYCRQMEEHKQPAMLATMLPLWQFVQNLKGLSADPVKLTGEIMDQDDVLDAAHQLNDQMTVATIAFLQLDLAYYFGDLKLAATLAKMGRRYADAFDPVFLICRNTFADGLVSLALAKNTSGLARRMHVTLPARRAIQKMKKWGEKGEGNVLHMLLLLQAEFVSLGKKKNKWDELKKMYDDAISTAGRSGFLQDKALANELAGKFALDQGEGEDTQFWASHYLTEAHELYCDWGATAKADQLLRLHGAILTNLEKHEENSGPGLRGRSRFIDHTKTHERLDYATGLDPEANVSNSKLDAAVASGG